MNTSPKQLITSAQLQPNRRFRTRLMPLAACLLLPAAAFAVTPAPDGGYPNNNTAEGTDALLSETTGTDNTAVGFYALRLNTTGKSNTAVGSAALTSNAIGANNTAVGGGALGLNTADENTATGAFALGSNTKGTKNTAYGVSALYSNVGGSNNTATGDAALLQNKGGTGNTADGFFSLYGNVSGDNNTAVGYEALPGCKGNNNIGIGAQAGLHLTTGNNNIVIGAAGADGESNTIRIGKGGMQKNTYIQGIYGTGAPNGIGVQVNAAGKLGVAPSSARFKEKIAPMNKASEGLLALQPVTFRYKPDFDPAGVPQFGLVAEEVEKTNPDLVVHDETGKPFAVRYEAVNAMLLNEFLKEHHTVEEQGATIAELKKQVADLTAGLQKVSGGVESSGPATQLAGNR